MDEKEKIMPDLLWSCFVNWLNTLEKSLKIDSEPNKSNFKEQLGLK